MTRLMKFGLTAFALLVSGCAAPPVASEKAMKIQVHTQISTILDRCKNLGPVTARATGETGWTESVIGSGVKKARYAIREQPYDMGGDTVVLLSADFVPPNQVQAQGQALRCAQK